MHELMDNFVSICVSVCAYVCERVHMCGCMCVYVYVHIFFSQVLIRADYL